MSIFSLNYRCRSIRVGEIVVDIHEICSFPFSRVIAILLGVLRLSIEETSTAFLRLCKEVSLGENVTPQVRSAQLVAATKALLQEWNVPEDSRLRGDLPGGEDCKVYIQNLSP